MVKQNIHQAVEVAYLKTDHCPLSNRQYSFFEMVYLISGRGFVNINGNRMAYRDGNLLLLTPNDHHHYEIVVETEFLLIRFSDSYIRNYPWKSIHHLECLLFYATKLSGCVMRCKEDSLLVEKIVDSLLFGMKLGGVYQQDLDMNLVNALIVIAARNIAKLRPGNVRDNTDKRILEIINHIERNIFIPEQLTAAAIGDTFGISQTYLGVYFKKQCGETLQQFISGYRIRLIEWRLKFSDLRINELADEFGFADGSHLNKFFKKQKGISLSGYRQALPRLDPGSIRTPNLH
ncbi:helix-turn-helix domain-containing protein [Pedobacter africanus]|uniref:AraC-type DNA-binding protein n=1 Tax=Pedobacter africanus TaxID=151894 RepID=A0A1W2DDD9_9SPHI|nr:AraC family transcriptional regulator [Pedobacter africanus]SMC94948.1 AraC-type DNA-binding protein [Pedobacter africanus]